MSDIQSTGVSKSQPLAGLVTLPPVSRSGQSRVVENANRAKQAAPAQESAGKEPAKTSLSLDQLQKMVAEIQKKVTASASELQLTVDEESGKSIIKVTDKSTKELVWQFPSEDALQVTKALDRFQQGLLLNRKA